MMPSFELVQLNCAPKSTMVDPSADRRTWFGPGSAILLSCSTKPVVLDQLYTEGLKGSSVPGPLPTITDPSPEIAFGVTVRFGPPNAPGPPGRKPSPTAPPCLVQR